MRVLVCILMKSFIESTAHIICIHWYDNIYITAIGSHIMGV
jgi:hypothetical protein